MCYSIFRVLLVAVLVVVATSNSSRAKTSAVVQPPVHWDRETQIFAVNCGGSDTVKRFVINDSLQDLAIFRADIYGPDAAEFSIIADQTGYQAPINDHLPYPIKANDSLWIALRFSPDLSRGYGNRNAYVVVVCQMGGLNPRVFNDTLMLEARITHISLESTPTHFAFGNLTAGEKADTTFLLHNNGDTDVTLGEFSFSNSSDFQVISGPKLGDILKRGDSVAVTIEYTASLKGGYVFDTLHVSVQNSTCEGADIPVFGHSVISGAVATKGKTNDLQVRVSPDPASDGATITANRSGMSVEIFDAIGKLVAHSQTSAPKWKWDCTLANGQPAPNGSYVVRVGGTSDDGSAIVRSARLIVRRR